MRYGGGGRERGFTAVELVVTVTVLGLIAVPLLMSLSGAIRIAPESSARASQAADRFFLSDTFTKDITNATGTATDTMTTTNVTACSDVASTEILKMQTFTAPPATAFATPDTTPGKLGTVTYTATITDGALEITRKSGAGGADSRVVTVGWCRPGDTDVITVETCDGTGTGTCTGNGSVTHESVAVVLKIRPRPADPIEEVRFATALGRTAPTTTVP